ncbi:MAG: hypothetical protein QOH68_4133 [Nocardioidaceae bacterium]|nr:hypothetical protein [Nocardioidaceae bacterium]
MTEQPDHELAVLEVDQTVPPRPEEEIADVGRDSDATTADRDATKSRG